MKDIMHSPRGSRSRMGGDLPLAAKSVPGRNDDLREIVTRRSCGVNGKQVRKHEEILLAVENEAMRFGSRVTRTR